MGSVQRLRTRKMYLLGMAGGVGSVSTSVWIFKWNWFYKLCFRNSEEGQRLSLGLRLAVMESVAVRRKRFYGAGQHRL